jgi:hypothetical protein
VDAGAGVCAGDAGIGATDVVLVAGVAAVVVAGAAVAAASGVAVCPASPATELPIRTAAARIAIELKRISKNPFDGS